MGDMAGVREEVDEVSAAAAAAAVQDGIQESETLRIAVEGIAGVVQDTATATLGGHTEVFHSAHNSGLAGAAIGDLTTVVAAGGSLAEVVCFEGTEGHSDGARRYDSVEAVVFAGIAVVVLAAGWNLVAEWKVYAIHQKKGVSCEEMVRAVRSEVVARIPVVVVG